MNQRKKNWFKGRSISKNFNINDKFEYSIIIFSRSSKKIEALFMTFHYFSSNKKKKKKKNEPSENWNRQNRNPILYNNIAHSRIGYKIFESLKTMNWQRFFSITIKTTNCTICSSKFWSFLNININEIDLEKSIKLRFSLSYKL